MVSTMETEAHKQLSAAEDKEPKSVDIPTPAVPIMPTTPTTPTRPGAANSPEIDDHHPSGKQQYGQVIQILRAASFGIYFTLCILAIHITQWLGAPLYLYRRDLYDQYMAKAKEFFGLTVVAMTQWWGPTTIRISGDAEVAKEMTLTLDGRIECSFPERMVMIANHQIYTDWLYLWWVGYTNTPRMHGHLYIILKESLKYIPFIGPGMAFFGFVFMSRKMATDQPRLAHRLDKLKQVHVTPTGSKYRNPMWLLLFPEGTNISGNGRQRSATWAKKVGVKDLKHMLLPRSAGLLYCLRELQGTVEYVYDCTVAYEGVPRGGYGEELFTLAGTYFQGRQPKSVNFHWRRFKIEDMPLDDTEKFDVWVRELWVEKDELMDEYLTTGRFPSPDQPHIITEVKTKHTIEFLQIFSIVALAIIMGRWVGQVWAIISWFPPFRWM